MKRQVRRLPRGSSAVADATSAPTMVARLLPARSMPVRVMIVAVTVMALLVAGGCSGFDDPTMDQASDSVTPGASNGSESDRGENPGAESPESSDGSEGPGDSQQAPASPGESPSDQASESESSDRLVIETSDRQLFTVKPDGSDRVDLTDPAENTDNSQAVWSPDGSRLAWTQIDRTTGQATLRTDRYDASSPLDSEVTSPPFYLSWSPTSSSVGYLHNSVGGFDLGVASVNPENPEVPPQLLDRGAPYFFAWGPDDDELLVHASDFRLDRIDLDGQTRIIEENVAAFGAPIWASEVDSLIFGRKVGDMSEVVATGTLGEGGQTLVRYEGSVRMVVSPAMNRIALVAYPLGATGEQGDGSIITASAPLSELGLGAAQTDPQDPADPQDPGIPQAPAELGEEPSTLAAGELTQVGIYGGEAWSIPTSNVVAFYWDPTGSVLAWLEPTSGGRMQWWFTDDTGVWPGPEFTPSSVFATEYLPFFDQYAQSHTFFSPSGEDLAFAGTLENGEDGVFVVSINPGAEPTKVGDGVMVGWSPTSAGGGAQSPL